MAEQPLSGALCLMSKEKISSVLPDYRKCRFLEIFSNAKRLIERQMKFCFSSRRVFTVRITKVIRLPVKSAPEIVQRRLFNRFHSAIRLQTLRRKRHNLV